MSFDNDTLPAIAPAPADLPQATRDTLRGQYERAGYAAEALAAAGYGPSAPAAKAAALPFGSDGTAAAATPLPSNRVGDCIPAGEKIAAFKRLRGVVPDATLQEAAKAEGVAWNEITTDAPATDTRLTVEEANARLAATSAPDAGSLSPADFNFVFDPAHIAELPPDDVRAIHDAFATGFHTAGVPVQLGQSLFREAMSSADRFADLSDVDKQLAFREEGARLQRLGNIDHIREDAEYAWSKLPQDFKEFAAEHYLFHSADSYAALGRAGALMRAREAKGRKQ
jgi:hypothetical protein